jgi:MFS family permease
LDTRRCLVGDVAPGFGTDIFQAGLVLAPGAVFMLVAAPIAGAIAASRGAKLPLFIGAAILAASFYYFYVLRATQLQIALGAIFVCIGVGFMLTAMINVVIQSVEQSQTGIATGMNTEFRTIGGALGPTIAGVFLAAYVSPLIIQTPRGPIMGPPLPNATAFNYIFLTGSGLAVVAMLVTLLIKGPVKMEEPAELLAVEES